MQSTQDNLNDKLWTQLTNTYGRLQYPAFILVRLVTVKTLMSDHSHVIGLLFSLDKKIFQKSLPQNSVTFIPQPAVLESYNNVTITSFMQFESCRHFTNRRMYIPDG